MNPLYTVGHSNHSIERLLELLEAHAVTAVADVRSIPFSRHNPQFNRENLQKSVKGAGMEYVFLGKELGARSEDRSCFVDGRVQFDLVARSELFQKGLARLGKGLETHRIALLCAEKDPITCHRMILVCRNMRRDDVRIRHILEDGTSEDNSQSERRLMRALGIAENNLFETVAELIERAYGLQGARIAIEEKTGP